MNIKAVCFDLDGVYFTPESFQHFKKNLPKEVTDEETINYVLYKSDEMMRFKTGKISEAEFWKFATDKLKITVGLEEIQATLRDAYEVNSEVRDFVKKVRAAKYITCICSNNFETRIQQLDAKFKFLQDFDVHIFSYQIGVMKPDKEIFRALVDISVVNPEEIVYSDDSQEKLSGALELGINAFVYENFEQFKNKLIELGVKV